MSIIAVPSGFGEVAVPRVLAVAASAVGDWSPLAKPALTHCVWLLVLVKLVTPPLLPLPLDWLPAARTTAVVATDKVALTPIVVNTVEEPESAGPPTPEDVWLEMQKTRAKETPIQNRVSVAIAPQAEPDGYK